MKTKKINVKASKYLFDMFDQVARDVQALKAIVQNDQEIAEDDLANWLTATQVVHTKLVQVVKETKQHLLTNQRCWKMVSFGTYCTAAKGHAGPCTDRDDDD